MNRKIDNINKFVDLLQLMLNEEYPTKELIEECAEEDILLTCKCLVYINSVLRVNSVTALLAVETIMPYLTGKEYAKAFFGPWSDSEYKGGIVRTPLDMMGVYMSLGIRLPNSVKKGFKKALESFSTEELLEYKDFVSKMIKLTHPNPEVSTATMVVDDQVLSTIDVIAQGIPYETKETLRKRSKPLQDNKTIEEHLELAKAVNLQ